jgi:O-antigen biosynthesis protein
MAAPARRPAVAASLRAGASPHAGSRSGREQLVEAMAALKVYRIPSDGRQRVTLIIDTIASGSLFGGAGTALILAALLANRRGADLRIITRTQPPVPANVDHLWQVNGVTLDGESQFVFAPRQDPRKEIDLMADELVVTTSWWTTAAALLTIPAEQIVYLLQEDERMFYLFGDVRLHCEQVFRHTGIRFVINTQLLKQHLVNDGFAHMAQSAFSFEPAFPASVYHPRPKSAGAKRRFVFYARPLNPRNLYFLGQEVIATAVERGILDPSQWELVFVGRDVPDVQFGADCVPVKRENLSWGAYAELIGGADLGLSLMYTPHPSYPPLDMAASGAVVVTNRHGLKQDLSPLCANIICCEPDREALVEGLRQGVALALDTPRREAQHRANVLQRDWASNLAGVVDAIAGTR